MSMGVEAVGTQTDLVLLRTQAKEAIKEIGGANRLSEILRQLEAPLLLDAPIDDEDFDDTLLGHSIRAGAVDCVRILIEAGVPPIYPRHSRLQPPQILALNAQSMSEEVIRNLVDILSSAGVDFNAKDENDWTCLQWAILGGSPILAGVLIERGAWIDPKLFDDAAMEKDVIPPQGDDDRPDALKTLRFVRAAAMGRHILSAMSDEPEAGAKQSPGMTL